MITDSKYESYARPASFAELTSLRAEDLFSSVKLARIVCGQQREKLGLFWGRIGSKARTYSHFYEVCF